MALMKGLTAAVIIFLTVATSSVSSIKCYQCNSYLDAHCQDLKANQTAAVAYLKECEDINIPPGSTPFCRKLVQTVVAHEDAKRTIRKCGFVKSEKPCYHFDDDDHYEEVCQCFEEACNSAPAARTGPAWRAALISLAMSAFLLVLTR